MRALTLIFSSALVCLLGSCVSHDRSYIKEVSDIPLKTAEEPGQEWAAAPLRSHAKYVMYGAKSGKQAKDCIGDYYFVTWYDADPTAKVKVLLRYTQAATGADELRVEKVYDTPRRKAASHTERFFFTGAERVKKGDILTWRTELYVNGKMVDSRQSYLWE